MDAYSSVPPRRTWTAEELAAEALRVGGMETMGPGPAPAPPPPSGRQTRIGSLIETLTNTAIGFLVSVGFSAIIYPLYGWTPSLAVNMQITIWFTLLSIARGYVLRRVFTRIKRLHT